MALVKILQNQQLLVMNASLGFYISRTKQITTI